MGKNKGFGKFLAGAAIGAGVALLFAPQDGKTTRRQLKKKLDELVEKVKSIDVAEVKISIENKIAEIKNDLKDLDREKVVAFAKEKANAIAKKSDELVKLAIAKGTPVVKKAAEEVRLKTIEVLENTITKLEKSEATAGATVDVPKKTTVKKAKPKTAKKTK